MVDHAILIEENRSESSYGHRVYYDGAVIIERTKIPLLDASRWMVANGKSGTIGMSRVATPDRLDMYGNIEFLSKVTITEPNYGKASFVKWTPYDRTVIKRQ